MSTHSATGPHVRHLWVGSYTGDMGQGDGVTRIDLRTGQREVLGDESPSPSWLVPTEAGVVAVSESEGGELTVLEPRASEIARADSVGAVTGAAWPCHASVVSPSLLAVAHYGSGTLTTVRLTDGRPGEILDVLDLGGRPLGPRSDRQDGSHPHQVVFDEARGELLVPDLGGDVVHRVPLEDGRLDEPLEPVRMPPGHGPRHLVLADDLLVVVGELSSQLWLGWRDDAAPGGWESRGTTPTLLTPHDPEHSSDPEVGNLPSAVRLHRDVLAVANRGADRVALYRVDPARGGLTPSHEVPTHGAWPRDLLLLEDDLWVACERSHTVHRVRWRGPDAGSLVSSYEVGSPTALLLL